MARFIKAENLEAALEKAIERNPNNMTYPRILDVLRQIPEDIVRCRDCANGSQTSFGFICGDCIKDYGQIRIVNPDGYCSHANRKE